MNNENRRQIIILAVLMIAAIGVFAYQFGLFGGAAAPSGGAAPAKTAAAKKTAAPIATTRLQAVEVNIDELLQGIKVVTFDYEQSRIDRNPMAPLVGYVRPGEIQPTIVPGTLLDVRRKRVSGIVYDPRDPVAVVDDEIVGLGHEYPDGIRVYAIEADRVVFQVGDTLVPVEMKEL
jgi:hypothetical protein